MLRLVSGRQPGPELLSASLRRPAAVLTVVCVTVTAVLAVSVSHESRAGGLDAAVDARIKAGLGGHHLLLAVLPRLGNPVPVTVMALALAVACLATRRWRGAVLAGAAVLVSVMLTELVLKPLIGRIALGWLSFPSGHATSMFALAAICAMLLFGPSRPPLPTALRLFLALTAVMAAAAVSAAMVALGFHYFSDIIGGAAVSIATVLLTALILDWSSVPAGTRSGDGGTGQADEAGVTARRESQLAPGSNYDQAR
jgi:membrane-associated phospholipid phosphatase